MTLSTVSRLKKGDQIARKPDGYACSVLHVNKVRRQIKIYDAHRNSVFLCNFQTLAEAWRKPG
jgi:hypothetical protein